MTNQEWEDCNELSDLRSENKALKEQLKAALAENTRLAEQVPQWRNPIFSKPKDKDKYVFAIVNGRAIGKDGICYAFFDAIEFAFYTNKKWFIKGFEYSPQVHIKRWMPLPDPPKEETNA